MSDDHKHWLLWTPEELERLTRLARELYQPEFGPGDIIAHPFPAVVEQTAFAFGDPGTESGHTIDTLNTDRTVALDGGGDYNFFIRFLIDQTETKADSDLTWALRCQLQVGGGGFATCPTTAGSNKVYISNHGSITQGDDTTDRLAGGAGAFLTDNNSVCDTSADTGSFTWGNSPAAGENLEVLISFTVQDAQAAAGDVFDFRLVRDDDTTITYTVADATLTWNAMGGSVPPLDHGRRLQMAMA